MIVGIDGDIVVYRSAFGAQKSVEGVITPDPVEFALRNCKSIIESICDVLDADDCILYLTASNDPTQYRLHYGKNYASSPKRPKGYKAHRAATPKPVHYQACRDYIMAQYTTDLAIGEEADDRLGIDLTSGRIQCIASLDKDLDMIPGAHYNWVKASKYKKNTLQDLSALYGGVEPVPGVLARLNTQEDTGYYIISPIEGLRNFYKQFLTGDAADNIPGIKGIGPVKASQMIDPLDEEIDMHNTVARLFDDLEDYRNIGRCLYIRKQPGEMWEPLL